jgi:hypothetical protein
MSRTIRALAVAFLAVGTVRASGPNQAPTVQRGYTIPLLDLADQERRQVVVDREPGQYLGHPTTVLLEDGRTIVAVYPKGHGRGAIVLKRSTDGGRSWSDRLPVPANWATSQETPTIHRVVDARGKRRRRAAGVERAFGNGSRYHESRRGCPRPWWGFAPRAP